MLNADEELDDKEIQEEVIPVLLGEPTTCQLTDLLGCTARLKELIDECDRRPESRTNYIT